MVSAASKRGPVVLLFGGAMVAAGVLAALAAGSGRRWSERRCRPARLPRLAGAIVGNTKSAVAQVLGPPRVATFVGRGPAVGDYRAANIWYYPLPKEGGRGMAIRFSDDRAKAVEFFDAPR